jgi:outer membrane protein OmpA-like peptidoglycan-associated protein
MSGGKSNPFESSMTDLMISLALIFMLLLASVLLQITHKNEMEKRQSGQTRDELIEELSKELSRFKIETKRDDKDPLSLVIVVGEEHNNLKFESDNSTLDEKDHEFLKKIIPIIMNLLYEKYQNEIDSIRIEGYTDDDGNDWHNLKLSQKRALEVLLYSLSSELSMPIEVKRFVIKTASINGRGETPDYLVIQDGKINKDKSRRVEIKIKIKSQEQKRLEKEMNQKAQQKKSFKQGK